MKFSEVFEFYAELLVRIITAIICYDLYESKFLCILSLTSLYPLFWVKWLIFGEVNLATIDRALDEFFNFIK